MKIRDDEKKLKDRILQSDPVQYPWESVRNGKEELDIENLIKCMENNFGQKAEKNGYGVQL